MPMMDHLHLEVAETYARHSKAARAQVGALIVRDDRPISVGINGTPSGLSNQCEGSDGRTLPSVIHAEANAILFAARHGISTEGADMFVSHSPCSSCAGLIIQAGIRRVVYRVELGSGLEMLREAGVDPIQVI